MASNEYGGNRPSESERLEHWLKQQLAPPEDDAAPTARPEQLYERQPAITLQLDALLVPQEALPFAKAPAATREVPTTVVSQSAVAPHQPPWISPTGPPPVMPAEPTPPVDTSLSAPPLPLDTKLYAAIKVAVWEGKQRLRDALAEHHVDELVWRQHEHLQREAIVEEACQGRSELAHRVRADLRAAREELLSAGPPQALDLESYVSIRARAEQGEPLDKLLKAADCTLDYWESTQDVWAVRMRSNPAQAREVRKALARARRVLKSQD